MKTLELNEDYQNDFDGKFGFVFDHTFVTNPTTSFCGRFSESPEKYGFEIWTSTIVWETIDRGSGRSEESICL